MRTLDVRISEGDAYFTSLVCSYQPIGCGPVRRNFEKAHAAEDAEDFPRRCLSICGANLCYFGLADLNPECRRFGDEQLRHFVWSEVGDEISKFVAFEHDT